MNYPELKKAARAIFDAGLSAVDPEVSVRRSVRRKGRDLWVRSQRYSLRRGTRIYVIGGGKACAPMAKALEKVLGDALTEGLIIVKYGHALNLEKTRVIEAGHPVPDEAGLEGVIEIFERLIGMTSQDIVICLLSGGGSSLLPLPVQGISLQDKQMTTQRLLSCGATIQEINAIRKHLSRVKGGQLVRRAYPARFISLVLSDVVGDPPDVIASGPTVADPTTFETCLKIIEKYQIESTLPFPVMDYLKTGSRGGYPETPKPDDPVFKRAQYVMVGNNRSALEAAKNKARRLGFHPLILSSRMEGETKEVAKVHAAIAREMVESHQPVRPPSCIISGGETTVTIRGNGKGGRNQEFALASALELEGVKGVAVLSGGTDGTDALTDAAGAYSDGSTAERARRSGLSPERHLSENNAYPLFETLGDLLITGPTRTNVMDIRLILVSA